MKYSTPPQLLLFVLFLVHSTFSFSQYTIEENENGFVLHKKGKEQKATVTELTYLKDAAEPVDAFYVQMKKKNALACKAENSEDWNFEWIEEVLIPDEDDNFAFSYTGLVHIKREGKHGLYSCINEDFLLSPTYDNISVDSLTGGQLKVEKGNLHSLFPSYRFLPATIEDQLIFAEDIRPYDRFFIFQKDGLWNVYTLSDNDSDSIQYVVQFEEGFDKIYDGIIAKKNGKFGLLRLSSYEDIPDSKKFYNHQFDSLYFIDKNRVLIGMKDGGYYYFNSAIKDFDGTYFSGQRIAMRPAELYLKDRYDEIMRNVDLLHGFWQVNEQPYDKIYETENSILVERNGLFGILGMDNFNTPSKKLNESACKSKSDEPVFFLHNLSDLISDEVISYDLLVNERNYGKQIFLFEYQNDFRFIGIDPDEDDAQNLASATSIEYAPNGNLILKKNGNLAFINLRKEYRDFLSFSQVAEQLKNLFWMKRPMPPQSYFEGYEILEFNYSGKTLQLMMDTRGQEYVVSKEFIKKYPAKEDQMEFLATQTKIEEYMKR